MNNVDPLRLNYLSDPCLFQHVGENTLQVHARFSDTFINESADIIATSIVNYANLTNKKTVAFCNIGDGLCEELLHKVNCIVIMLLAHTSIKVSDMMLVTGNMNSYYSINAYKEYCVKFNWIQLPLRFVNGWESSSASHIKAFGESAFDIFDTTPRLKNKKVLCFNRRGASHRWYITAKFIEHNFLDQAFFSMYQPADAVNVDNTVIKNSHNIEQVIRDNAELFPLKLSLTTFNGNDAIGYHPMADVEFFTNSYFSLIPETKFFKEPHCGCGHLDGHFLTEKTYKVISAKHPFILMHRPYVLRELRNSGYQTFHPYIDERYDTIEDDELRLEYIINEIERLYKFTDDEWIKFQTNVQSILLHNFNLLSSRLNPILTIVDNL